MKAILGVPRALSWFDTAGTITLLSQLQIKVYLAGVEQANLVVAQNTAIPSLFTTALVTFSVEGTYTVVVFKSSVAIDNFQVQVSPEVVPDYLVGVAAPLSLSLTESGPVASTRKVFAFVVPLGVGLGIVTPAVAAPIVVTEQRSGALALPNNSAVAHYFVITTSGGTATIGQLLYDNGSDNAAPVSLVTAAYRVITSTNVLTGGTISFAAGGTYVWDTEATAAWVPAGPVATDATAASLSLYATATAAYLTREQFAFSAVDAYCLVWFESLYAAGVWDTPVAFYAQDIFAANLPGLESVWFSATTPEPSSAPIVGATVVVSAEAGGVLTWLAQGVTGSDGALVLSVPAGVCLVSLLRSGDVFSVNNFAYEVVNTTLEGGGNAAPLTTAWFTPTVANTNSAADTCTLTLQLYHMDGTPVAHADVQVGTLNLPSVAFGAGVATTRARYKTNSNGYLTFSLLQGMRVEVAIASVGIRRIVTIPAESGPINLLTLLSAADDVFDVITPVVPAAPKHSLL